MKIITSNAHPKLLEGHFQVAGKKISRKAAFPCVLALLAVAVIFSPLFNLHHIHGFPGTKLYTQHLFFDGIADAGGFYASTFCKHWYHRLPIAVGFALVTTLALVTLVG